jgi:hypothetical protein
VANYLMAIDIRTQMRTMERAAVFAALREKKLILYASAALGNAARRLETSVLSSGI